MRLDQLLVQRKFFESRSQAASAIRAGRVSVGLKLITKPGEIVGDEAEIRVAASLSDRFVSRAALKLQAALERRAWDLSGTIALDVGQSTGGFTQVMLEHGAKRVVGIEVGHDQLHPSLRVNPDVTAIEKFNARHLAQPSDPACQPLHGILSAEGRQAFGFIAVDVSFISLKAVLPAILNWADPIHGKAVLLVKPQFEVGPNGLNKKGVVKDPTLYSQLETDFRSLVESLNWTVVDYFESPIQGGDGNREFLLAAERNGAAAKR